MLHIILLILKIIGIVLLALIGLLLLLLLTILLVPVRYRIKAAHGENLFSVEGTISWLLHVMHARISMKNDKPHILVRIFGIKIFDSLRIKRPKAKKEAKPDKDHTVEKSSHQKKDDSNKEVKKLSKTDDNRTRWVEKKDGQEQAIKTKIIDEGKLTDHNQIDPNSKDLTIEEAKDRNLSDPNLKKLKYLNKNEPDLKDLNADDGQTFLRRFLNKVRNIKEKIITFFRTLKERIKNWIKVSFNVEHKIHLISAFLKDEGNRDAFRLTFRSLKKLLKHVLPTKLKSSIIFGTGDPCSTGQALGALSILYSFYGDKIQITPDFENKRLEGKHYARGRIRLVTILIIVIKLILDKRFKQLKSNMKTLKEAL
jgi:hypothetical protein